MITRWYQRISTRFALVFYFSFAITLLVFAALTVWSARETTFTTVKDNLVHQTAFWENYLKDIKVNPSEIRKNLYQYSELFETRLTLMDSSGTVLFDSDVDSALLGEIENHLSRPEIQQSLTEPFGNNIRHSVTTDHDFYYLAKKTASVLLTDHIGSVYFIRVAYPMKNLSDFYVIYSVVIILLSFLFLIAGFFLYKFIAERLTEPILNMVTVSRDITQGNLDSRIQVSTSDEFSMLAKSINQMAEKLVEDIQKLKKLEQVRSEFLANVSHELKTPIFTIQGFVETLLDGAIDDESVNKVFLNKIHRNSISLNNLVSDLIEISKIETGELKMKFQPVHLSSLLDEIIEDLEPSATAKNIVIKKEMADQDVMVWADGDRIHQVFNNLITNGIKYSDNGDIVVSCENRSAKSVLIKVRDHGIGIPQEHLPRIFERFYRVDKHRSKEVGGTGLGLAIVKHIIEAHRSKITVSSVSGGGTEFSFHLTRYNKD